MRIKLNILQLIPDRNPSVYWLHVDDKIVFIRQLKEKVQKVLKESRDIELCVDNVPFLDEDVIHAINENEEVTVIVVKKNNFIEPNTLKASIKECNNSESPSNGIYSTEPVDFKSDNEYESTISSILPKNSKKRVRKRTHKKKKQELESTLPTDKNGFSETQPEILITSPKVPKKLHKRFKLDNEENNEQDDGTSESSDNDCLQVTREVFLCNSSFNDNEEKKSIKPGMKVWRKETTLKTKITKVPIFVRGQTGKSENSIQTNGSNTSEDCDVLVVDWKNMSPMKVSNLSDLQISDLIQFKTLSLNENGEPQLSSVITARLENIYKTTLLLQVLSGIKEFMTTNDKFKMEEEDLGTQREVDYNDLFEVYKLV